MWLTRPTPWGEIRGKLSTTPEQALRMFGFVQAPDAKGVLLRRMIKGIRKTKNPKYGINICNFYYPSNPNTPAQQAIRAAVSGIGKIAVGVKGIIRCFWDSVAAISDKPLSGYDLFLKVNIENVYKVK